MAFWRKIDLNIILIFLLTSFVIVPLARPGFPLSGAGFRPIWNLNVLAHCDGWPAVAEAPDMVRGGGLLPLYVARPFQFLGADPPGAIKWSLALAYLIGGLAIYGWLRDRWGKPAALLAAVVYTFLPYRLSVTYIAGGLSDPWAMGLYPLVGWALWSFSERVSTGRGLLAFAAWGLLALTNLGLAIWFAIIAGLALLAAGRNVKALLPLLPAVPLLIWGIATSPSGDFGNHHLYLFQLFSASWNNDPSGTGWRSEMPFQLGLIPLGLAGLGVALAGQKNTDVPRRPLIVLTIGVALTAALSLHLSDIFWRLTHLDRLLTYPWQLLGVASLGLALLAGSVARQVKQLATMPWLAGLIALAVVSVYGYLSPAWTELEAGDLPRGVYGENQVALIDYEFIGQVYPGAEVQLDVTWQSLRPLDKDYTVFVQALGPAREIWGQQDIQPQDGDSPTSSWVPGQIIADTYILKIDPAGPWDDYEVIIGFYDGQTGERLAVEQDDKVILYPTPDERRVTWPCQEVAQ